MIFAQCLESTSNDFDSESWEPHSEIVLHFVENCHFSLHAEWTIIIKQHSKDVTELDNAYKLVNVVSTHFKHALCKEMGMMDQLIGKIKFRLEISPNFVVFAMINL